MREILLTRSTAVWLLLVGATLVSFTLGHGFGLGDHRLASAAIIIVAFVKIRFVIRDFMEIGNAPLVMRLVGDVWVMAAATALTLVYWLGSAPEAASYWPVIQGL